MTDTPQQADGKLWTSGRAPQHLVTFAMVVAALAALAYAVVLGPTLSRSPANWGQFGDYWNGLLSPFIALATLVAIVRTVQQNQQLVATTAAQVAHAERELTEAVQRREAGELSRRRKAITLTTAELVNVAAGLLEAKRTTEAALAALGAGGHVPGHPDFTSDLPRPMPFTSALGTELFLFSEREIDALLTLHANLEITRREMTEITEHKRPYGIFGATALDRGLAHSMRILAEAFEALAPSRKLALDGDEPRLPSLILRQRAQGSPA